MNIQFMGAAQTVTGSCYIIEALGIRFCVDCGMHQGNSEMDKRNFETKMYRPGDINFIALTHAHIDHSGLLPRIIRDGFKGSIYCTAPTADLVSMMLEDSGHIQETEASWKSKKLSRGGNASEVAPLYTIEDAKKVPEHLQTIEYDQSFEPHPGIVIRYRNAGHILGAAFLEITVTEAGKTTRLVFSGDLGRPGTLLMHHPEIANHADYLFLESTYGDRNHKNESDTLNELLDAIKYAYKNREKVIIPAFAVGRTQEILYSLYLLHKKSLLPADIPIYVDSPMAIRATEIFAKYKTFLDMPELPSNDKFDLPNLHFVLTAQESQALNTQSGTGIIIAASGMCNAGRVRHHLRHNLWRPGAAIVFVGYQGIGTPGRSIVDGTKKLRLFGEDVAVKAKVFTINGFSAHAGQSQLIDWLEKMQTPNMRVILIHGEEKAQNTLANLIKEKFHLEVAIPDYLETMTLISGSIPITQQNVEHVTAQSSINFDALLRSTDFHMEELRQAIKQANGKPWVNQVEIKDRLLELNKEILSVLSGL